ncbi:MAG TPA: homoserine O-succinyltransferase [Caulobacteraceae bacterium]|jgi:homoserine O-succinyltransferase
MADGASSPRSKRIEIGLINNMPDAALAATERQFSGLIEAVAGDLDVRLRLFSLSDVPRGEITRLAMRHRYADVETLNEQTLDALIVTGAEPKTPDLLAEPYWPQMARLINWAEQNTLSTLWSCLAAHAAVLHLDGIQRRPLAQKCAGVFLCEQLADDPLMSGVSSMIRMPHSRRNALAVGDLVARGYHLLTESREVGADLFVRRGRSLFVFFQGHPEYDADSLLKEYCRDVGRHLRREQSDPPALPRGYFDTCTETAFRVLAAEARRSPNEALLARCSEIAAGFHAPQPWRQHAEVLFGNWLKQIAAMKAERTAAMWAGAQVG